MNLEFIYRCVPQREITFIKVRRLMPSSLGTRGGGGGSSHHGGGRGDKLVTISPERGYGKSSDDEF